MPDSIYFAPAVDLGSLDIAALQAATKRLLKLRAPLNIAMYAFTDSAIAQALIAMADAGVLIRVYRDGEQYWTEELDAKLHSKTSVTEMFLGHASISVRVKALSETYLMHLKCWSDGKVLRDGSANWSVSGLKCQDNSLRFTTNTKEVLAFNQDFEKMWARPTNVIVQ